MLSGVTLFKDPKAAIYTENAYRKPPGICKIIQEAACDKLVLAHFPCSQWGRIVVKLGAQSAFWY